MDYTDLVRRSLAVAPIIQEQNKELATAHRLRQRAGLPNAEGAVDLASRVVDAAVEMLEDGGMDPMFGGYGELNDTATLILDRLPDELPERETRHTAEMLITAIAHYVIEHGDDL